MEKKTPEEDFIVFGGNVVFDCVDYTNLTQGVNFDNASNDFIQKLIDLCQKELAKRKEGEMEKSFVKNYGAGTTIYVITEEFETNNYQPEITGYVTSEDLAKKLCEQNRNMDYVETELCVDIKDKAKALIDKEV